MFQNVKRTIEPFSKLLGLTKLNSKLSIRLKLGKNPVTRAENLISALPIVHKHMRLNQVPGGGFERKVAGTIVAKIVTSIRKGIQSMNVNVGSYGHVALVRRRKRKMWDPSGHLGMCTPIWSFNFKQWDPDKFCVGNNFHNLEDKVDFEGVSNVMILEAQIMSNPKVKGSGDSSTF
ncbi:hypothetical protein QL285_092704 [Trifolium repens]|jgi:hypothetical protein|nr:hypothetical protein QL285_092704 [Trifolium repens]